jgi:oligopeptide/dipeptide ABC transporter ATP-binding protein
MVEAGAKEKIFAQPAHPYTEALLRAIPILGHKAERLHNIPGEHPMWRGCRPVARSIHAVPMSCPNVVRPSRG